MQGRGRPKGHRSEALSYWFDHVFPIARPAPGFERVHAAVGQLYSAIQSIVARQTQTGINERTIQRALNGEPIDNVNELRITSALREIFPSSPPVAPRYAGVTWIEGTWEVGYVEDDLTDPLHITRERATCTGDGFRFSGRYECLSYDRQDEFAFDLDVSERCVWGRYYVVGRTSPVGSGVFQLAATRKNDFLQGHCTWLDFDKEIVMSSPCIWYRNGAGYSDLYERNLVAILSREISLRTQAIESEVHCDGEQAPNV